MLGIVIPTIAGREESYRRALDSYYATSKDFPGGVWFQVEEDHPTCGSAWDAGALAMPKKVTHIHFGADDIEAHEGWWQPLAEAADAGYCGCAVVLNPDGSVQSAGMSGWQAHTTIPEDWAPVEHTLTPFLTRKQWGKVEYIPRTLHFCTDIWVSARLGIPVVVRTGSVLTHHNHPAGRGAGMDIHERNRHDRALFARLLAA